MKQNINKENIDIRSNNKQEKKQLNEINKNIVNSVVIKNIGYYIPGEKYENQYFEEFYEKKNIKVKNLFKSVGRNTRYFANKNNENVISMAKNATQYVFNESKLLPEEIDMLVFVTDTPEYTIPSNAIMLQSLIGAKKAQIVFDMNTNCTGMVNALTHVSKIAKCTPGINNILIVGSMHPSLIAKKDDPLIYGTFADAGCAVLLQKEQYIKEKGVLDSAFYVNSDFVHTMKFPECGFSKLYNEKKEDNSVDLQKYFASIPFESEFIPKEWTRMITEILDRQGLIIDDISHFIFSQLNYKDIATTMMNLKVPLYKQTFLADRYGYTGNTSPILALKSALKRKVIKEGDKIIMCAMGAGCNLTVILYQF